MFARASRAFTRGRKCRFATECVANLHFLPRHFSGTHSATTTTFQPGYEVTGPSERVPFFPSDQITDNPLRVFVDDVSVAGGLGGKAYETYGISSEGAIVVVRPDGYVATAAPFDGSAKHLEPYFSGFMREHS